MKTFNVLSPVGKSKKAQGFKIASRIGDLSGKKLGLFWNGKHNGEILLDRIAELLQDRFRNLKISKFNYSFEGVGPEAINKMVKNSDLVIAAIAD